jgi:hypothetical protein
MMNSIKLSISGLHSQPSTQGAQEPDDDDIPLPSAFQNLLKSKTKKPKNQKRLFEVRVIAKKLS